MNNNEEEYEKLINNLSYDNFNFLVKEYAKEYYGTNELHISNGPYDGGLDLVIFKNGREVKRNIQITITKSKIEQKLFEDVDKSSRNVSEYGYQSKLDFYISGSLTQTKKQKLVRKSEVDFDIDLKIVDAKKLARSMEEFPIIKKTLKRIYEFNENDSIFEISDQNKLIYNVLASGEDSTKIKRHLIHAYIVTSLFETPKQDLQDLYTNIQTFISASLTKDDLFEEINYLKSKKYIDGKSLYQLSESYNENLSSLLELNNIQEKDLTLKLDEVIKEKGLSIQPEELSKKLIEMYVQHFRYNLEEVESSENSFAKSTRKIFNEIVSLITKSGISGKQESENLAKEILNITTTNDFLTKIGASSMYLNLYNSDQLEEFIISSSRRVCLDTQILLRLLCVLLKPITSDHSLTAIYSLHQVSKNTDLNLNIFTSNDYIGEVSAHLQKALKIYNYIKLPIFEKVGRTRNVFYNFYIELINKGETKSPDFRSFIENELLAMKIPDEFDKDFLKIVDKRLIRLFENLGYEVISPEFYEKFEVVKKEFEKELAFNKQIRSGKAIKHDVKTALYMSDEQNHYDFEEELFLEPYVITWDYQFYKLRNIAMSELDDYKPWFVFTPQKFIEKIQLSNFKIKPESINETILSIVESDYNSSSNSKSFLDVISSIFNKENVNDLKLAQKFANIEQDYLEEQEKKENFKIIPIEESPLTKVLSILISHYNDPESDKNIDDLTLLFEDDSKADSLIKIITDSIENFKSNTLDKEKLTKHIDLLMQNDV